jgi:hypothetical protein
VLTASACDQSSIESRQVRHRARVRAPSATPATRPPIKTLLARAEGNQTPQQAMAPRVAAVYPGTTTTLCDRAHTASPMKTALRMANGTFSP